MKKIIIGLAVVFISITSLVIWNFCIQPDIKSEKHASAAAIIGSDQQITLPSGKGEKGSDTNPFIILEVVPYEGYAEIGYSIQGSEPIPMDQMRYNQNGNLSYTNLLSTTQIIEYSMDISASEVSSTNTFGKWYFSSSGNQYG